MQRPNDDQLSAWLDGELDAGEREAIDAWLREHPEDAARVQLWAADRDALRARFDAVLGESVPAALHGAVWDDPAPHRAVRDGPAPHGTGRDGPALHGAAGPGPQSSPTDLHAPWQARPRALAAMAAVLVVGGGLIGATLAWQLKPGADPTLASRSTWTHRAAVAHVVYVPEVRHPVEVVVAGAPAAEQRAQEEHLARWLTKRLEMPVRLFDLRSHGFELVGGRLLPDAVGPSAQLMYQNSAGQRVTVYLRRPEPGSASAFRFHREGDVGMFYWTEDGYGCALVGTLPREKLLALAESAYQQTEAAHAPPAPTPPKPVS